MNELKSLAETLRTATKEAWSKFASGRSDDWQNTVTGFGTQIDKTTYTSFIGRLKLNDQALSNLYHGDDLAARMVDIVPDELLREGFSVDCGDAHLNGAIAEQLDALGCDGKFADAWRWGRLYGGAALVLGADDGRSAATPLQAERAKALSFLHVLDRRYLWPLTYYTDSTSSKLGQPETYMVSAVSSRSDQAVAVIHESRLILFGGATTGSREREQNNSWDHSVLERAIEPLRAFNTGWKSVEVLLTDANQAVFKMQGMSEMIAAEGQEAFKRRMQLVDMCRSVMRAMVVDGGSKVGSREIPSEEFLRHSVSFADIPQVLDKFMLRLAAAVQIPVTILMGQSPAGMNATGDSDFRWFYDRVKSEQTRHLSPKIRRLIKVMLATKAFNAKPDSITVKFPPLWTETPLAAAQTRKVIADTDAVRIGTGELLPEEVALQRARGDGYETDIILDDRSRAVRESALTDELKRIEEGPPEPVAPALNGPPEKPLLPGSEETPPEDTE